MVTLTRARTRIRIRTQNKNKTTRSQQYPFTGLYILLRNGSVLQDIASTIGDSSWKATAESRSTASAMICCKKTKQEEQEWYV
mmetsp:Transcript_23736/g.48714  ORF Transcript_23736/g.48714 Transcript_23736/m.48714 type:complete len:83 (+) Transcript_23736:480-728(+)